MHRPRGAVFRDGEYQFNPNRTETLSFAAHGLVPLGCERVCPRAWSDACRSDRNLRQLSNTKVEGGVERRLKISPNKRIECRQGVLF
jgi:hypothetical protein